MSRVKVLFGTYFFGSQPKETSQEFFNVLKAYNVKDLDTAYQYVSSLPCGIDFGGNLPDRLCRFLDAHVANHVH